MVESWQFALLQLNLLIVLLFVHDISTKLDKSERKESGRG